MKIKSKKKEWTSKKRTIVALLALALGIAIITPFYITAKADEKYYCYYAGGTGASKQSRTIECDKGKKPADSISANDGTLLYYVSGPYAEGSSDDKKYQNASSNTNTTDTSGDDALDQELLEALYGKEEASKHQDEIPSFDLWDPINSGAACIGWSIFKIILKTGSVGSEFFNFSSSSLTWAGLVPIPNFTNDVMKGFVYLLSWIAQIMLAIGILLSIGEETIRYGNGQGNFASTIMNFIKAIGFTVIFVIFGCTMFQVANQLGIQGAAAIMQGDNNTFTGGADVTNVIGSGISVSGLLLGAGGSISALGGGGIIFITVAILFAVLWIKTIFFYMKKVPQMVAMLGKGSVLPFFMARGQTQAVTSYLQQLGMFYLQIVLQFAFLAFGMNIMGGGASGTEGVLTSVALGAIMILSIDEIDRWIGGLSGEDDLNKAVSFMHHSNIPSLANGVAGGLGSVKNALSLVGNKNKVGEAGDAT